MTRKPTTKSPEERRLRAQIRSLLQVHLEDHSRLNTDYVVREFLNLIDDEVRRTRMSIAPVITPAGKPDITKPFFWTAEDEPGPMTDDEYKERTHIKKTIAAALLEGKLPFPYGGKS